MANDVFVIVLGVLAAGALGWGFRSLPQEGWQIAASVPITRDDSGQWRGLNLTYYGILQASAYVCGVAMVFIPLGAVGIPPRGAFVLTVIVLAVCAPASKLVARIVEKRRGGFTVGGAVFVGVLLVPWAFHLANAAARPLVEVRVPLVPALAAAAIGYAVGEGMGRLACVSFGCCYGKPLGHIRPRLRRLFEHHSFVFSGKTKKVAYEGGLEGEKVVPVQGITAVLFVAVGLAATALYLHGRPRSALCLALLATQGWRSLSEILRADYRGGGRVSTYQWMAIATVLYLLAALPLLPSTPLPAADVVAGLRSLWDPSIILFLQVLWIAIFLYTGRSMVTGAVLSFHVQRDRA